MIGWIIAGFIAFLIGFSLGERSEYRRVKKILEGSSGREN